jgi:hypothetical protein
MTVTACADFVSDGLCRFFSKEPWYRNLPGAGVDPLTVEWGYLYLYAYAYAYGCIIRFEVSGSAHLCRLV